MKIKKLIASVAAAAMVITSVAVTPLFVSADLSCGCADTCEDCSSGGCECTDGAPCSDENCQYAECETCGCLLNDGCDGSHGCGDSCECEDGDPCGANCEKKPACSCDGNEDTDCNCADPSVECVCNDGAGGCDGTTNCECGKKEDVTCATCGCVNCETCGEDCEGTCAAESDGEGCDCDNDNGDNQNPGGDDECLCDGDKDECTCGEDCECDECKSSETPSETPSQTPGTSAGSASSGGGASAGASTSAAAAVSVPATEAETVAALKTTASSSLTISAPAEGITADILTALTSSKNTKNLTVKYGTSMKVVISKDDVKGAAAKLDFTKGANFLSAKAIAGASQLKSSEKVVQLNFAKEGDFGGVSKVKIRSYVSNKMVGKTAVVYEYVNGKLVKVAETKVAASGNVSFNITHYGQYIIAVE